MSVGRMVVDAFFDGFGPGGLFVRIRRPGAPVNVFQTGAEFLETGGSAFSKATPPARTAGLGPSSGELAHRVTKA